MLNYVKSHFFSRRRFIIFIFLFIVISLVAQEDAIVGKWLTAGGKSIIKIEKQNSQYFGKIVWLKEPVYPKGDANEGKEKMDINNPIKEKRTQKLIGLKLLWGFKYKKDKWIGGKIYDPENGKVYHCKIKLNKDGNLIIKGSIDKWGLVGRSTVWTKVNDTNTSKN